MGSSLVSCHQTAIWPSHDGVHSAAFKKTMGGVDHCNLFVVYPDQQVSSACTRIVRARMSHTMAVDRTIFSKEQRFQNGVDPSYIVWII